MKQDDRNLNEELNDFPNETTISNDLESKVLIALKNDGDDSHLAKRYVKWLPYLAFVACLVILIPLGLSLRNHNTTDLIVKSGQVTGELNQTISNAILTYNQNAYQKTNNDKSFEAHKVYGVSKKHSNIIKVYMYVLYEQYNMSTKKVASGGSGAVLLTLKEVNGKYQTVSYQKSRNGSLMVPSIKNMFPQRFAQEAIKDSTHKDSDLQSKLQEKITHWLQSSRAQNSLQFIKLKMIDNQTGWAVTDNGSLLKTANGWKTHQDVTPKQASFPKTAVNYFFLNKQTVFIFYMDASKLSPSHIKTPLVEWVSFDGGATWKKRTFSDIQDWGIEDITFIDQDIGWIYTTANGLGVHPSHIYQTVDGGVSWKKVNSKDLYRSNPTWLSSTTSKLLWSLGMKYIPNTDGLDTSSTMIMKSIDGGNHWLQKALLPNQSKMSIDYHKPTFIGSSGVLVGVQYPKDRSSGSATLKVFHLNSKTNTWRKYSSFVFNFNNRQQVNYPFFNPKNVTLQFVTLNRGWLHTNKAVFKTINGGKTWIKLNDSSQFPVHFQFISVDVGYGYDNSGVYKTSNGGENWKTISLGKP